MGPTAHHADLGPKPSTAVQVRAAPAPYPARLRPAILSLAVGALVWEVAGHALHFIFLPPLSTVLRATWRMSASGEIPGNLGASLVSLGVGYGLAVLAGAVVVGGRRLPPRSGVEAREDVSAAAAPPSR